MLTIKQRAVLAAVCEAMLSDPAAARGATLDRVESLIDSLTDPGDRARLAALLTALGNPLSNLALGGRFASLEKMDIADRRDVLMGWAHSRFGVRRAGFQALKRLANISYYCWPKTEAGHPAWDAVGYPGPLPQPEQGVRRPETHPIEGDTRLDCDVVVVGSGAGGGVVAGVLADAGFDVIVVEKGSALGAEDMTQFEGEMLGRSYLDGGLVMTHSGSMPILAGSCVGGGTVINYTTSFALPERTRREWDGVSGLNFFSGPRFAESLERVSSRLDVGTKWTTPGKRDEILERGLEMLGWHVDAMPRNVTDCPEGLECGYCAYGCRHGAKNDTAKTYLADAAGKGMRLIADCTVDRVLRTSGRAAGVAGRVRLADGGEARLTVNSRTVVVCCGALHTPALLMRSGLSNPNIGGNLHLHPATGVLGIFPERIEPWSGAMQTRYSDQFADIEGGYGVKFETAPIHLALPASAFGWEGAEAYAADVEQLAHTSVVGMLMRDRDAGRVDVTKNGNPRVHYDLSAFDAAHIHAAMRGAAELLGAAGASEVRTLHSPPVRADTDDPGWLDEFHEMCARRGYRRNRMSFISFHQMGTAAMGADRRRSVVGEAGETHELPGLYVADASTFPTSSGVNPMITIMAIADHVARSIAGS